MDDLDRLEMEEEKFRLARAVRRKALLASVPRQVAAAFGVFPLDNGTRLTLATLGVLSPRCAPLLEAFFQKPVTLLPFHPPGLFPVLHRHYLGEEPVSLATFPEEDFLVPQNLALLTQPKEDLFPSPWLSIPPGHVTLVV
mgnify:CR=1 FL=1